MSKFYKPGWFRATKNGACFEEFMLAGYQFEIFNETEKDQIFEVVYHDRRKLLIKAKERVRYVLAPKHRWFGTNGMVVLRLKTKKLPFCLAEVHLPPRRPHIRRFVIYEKGTSPPPLSSLILLKYHGIKMDQQDPEYPVEVKKAFLPLPVRRWSYPGVDVLPPL